MDTQYQMQIEARLREWNSVVERERTLHHWKRLVACCRAAARRAAEVAGAG